MLCLYVYIFHVPQAKSARFWEYIVPAIKCSHLQNQGEMLALKALFIKNNVSTFKKLSCMALYAISVFDKV